MYKTFTRTWWKIVNGKRVPSAGKKMWTGNSYMTEEAARAECQAYNAKTTARQDRVGHKMEYTS